MNHLITRCLVENDPKWLSEIPEELMYEREKEIVQWVVEYSRKHKHTPSEKRVMEMFDGFIPYKFEASTWEEEDDPISDVFDQTIQRKLLTVTENILRDASTVMRNEKRVPLEMMNQVERIHTMALGVTRYSKFDRSLYFRRTSMNVPFRLINRHIGGISNGDFMLIIGRLGTGKSTIAQWMAKAFWEEGKRILFISAEMMGLDVFSRIDAMVGKFNPLKLREGATEEMTGILGTVFAKVKDEAGEIIIPRNRLLTPSQIGAFAKNLQVDIIVVDGAYLLKPSDKIRGAASKWETVSAVSNELKQLALDLDLPLIATAQIKRGADGAEGYTPEDIGLSDALGQDSDFVLAVYPDPVVEGSSELQLIKNRYGSICATRINVDFETMTVIDETFESPRLDETPEDWKSWTRKVKSERGIS